MTIGDLLFFKRSLTFTIGLVGEALYRVYAYMWNYEMCFLTIQHILSLGELSPN